MRYIKIGKLFNIRPKRWLRKESRVVLVTPPASTGPTYARSSPDEHVQVLNNPTVPLLPLGPAYVAASLKEAGIDVLVLDLTFEPQPELNVGKIKETIMNLDPLVVGISSFTSTILSAYEVAKAVKEEDGSVPIVIGGPHASALPQRTLEECSALDAAIIGEGEYVFRDFVKSLSNKGSHVGMSNAGGLLLRQGGRFIGDPRPVYVEDLNTLPFPDRHLFDLSKYAKTSYSFEARRFPVASIITSRGCPHSCLFCSRVNGGYRFRARSPDNVVQELEQLKEQGFNEVLIVDDAFTEDRSRILELCRLINARKLNMSFNLIGGIRVDRVDKELLTAMYDAGCYSIHFGAESGDDMVLQCIRKGITPRQVKEAVRTAKEIGYQVNLYVIVGLPGSSVESEKRTLDLVRECMPDMTRVSFCTPYPGSPLWDMVEDRLNGVSWDRYSETNILNPIFMSDGLSPDQIEFWMNALTQGL